MKPEKIIGSVLLVLVVGGGIYLALKSPQVSQKQKSEIGLTERYKEIANPAGFVNSNGITIQELVGKKVILVDFMTYSCINCQRSFPHVTAWYEKYKDEGLEIVGIHTPEFAFEKDIENVRKAMKDAGITYPVVLDNQYGTWRAYGNQYWPRKYLIDINGNIVYDHIGEGAYEETEAKIRELLDERARLLDQKISLGNTSGLYDITSFSGKVQSPEIYFGSSRSKPTDNVILGGSWNVTDEYVENSGEATIVYNYDAKNVYFVGGSKDGVQVEIYKDGVLLEKITVKAEQLYTLIEGDSYGKHTLQMVVKGSGLQAFTFTFG